MITVQRHGESITGSVNGKPFGIAYNEKKFEDMLKLQQESLSVTSMDDLNTIVASFEMLTKEDYKTVIETACPDLYVTPASGKFFIKHGKVISTKPVPTVLANRILESIDKNIDPQPLIKAWIRFLRNPNFSDAKAQRFANFLMMPYTNRDVVGKLVKEQGLTEELARERATTTQVAVTVEGIIVGYKVARELKEKWILDAEGNKKKVSRYTPTIDENTGLVTYQEPEHVEDRVYEPAIQGQSGDAFQCIGNGHNSLGHIYRVGCRQVLPDWSMVDCSDEVTCKPGLHAGGLHYIEGYQTEGTVTHNVFIDPAMIGAIPDDRTGAVRVKELFIFSSFQGPNKGIYHSSDYAKMTDAEWENMKIKALEIGSVNIEENQKALEELNEL